MSRHFNADERKSLHDPIAFRLGGADYEVLDLTDDLMEKVQTFAEEGEDCDLPLSKILAGQLAILTGEDPEVFQESTIRQKAGVLDWIMESITDPNQKKKAKNGRRK